MPRKLRTLRGETERKHLRLARLEGCPLVRGELRERLRTDYDFEQGRRLTLPERRALEDERMSKLRLADRWDGRGSVLAWVLRLQPCPGCGSLFLPDRRKKHCL